MMKIPFNRLNAAQMERLTLLASEASEVIQAITKVQLHGYHSCHPERGTTNQQDLEEELGHFQNALKLMYECGDVRAEEVLRSRINKQETFKPYLHHQSEWLACPSK